MSVDLSKEINNLNSLGLLNKLLIDKTTNSNIIWATDNYCSNGVEYEKEKSLNPSLICRKGIIQSRFNKDLKDQQNRTRKHAEVFTPLWVCNKMNNILDKDWFGYPNVFNDESCSTSRVNFPKGKTWKDYVDSRRLEITCGEAPFIVSRYDSETGKYVDIPERIGVLDRKLRIVSENTDSEEEWLKWTFRAFESVYGYEFQGDNILLARVNLLKTFEEYLDYNWSRKPKPNEYKKIINRITWNIWQMDGLTGMPPYKERKQESIQTGFFTNLINKNFDEPIQISSPCYIKNWRSGRKEIFIRR